MARGRSESRGEVTQGSGTGAVAGKYLTFVLRGESYGIGVLQVQEIIRMTEITRVPRVPHFVRGVINLRGKITPVIDMRLKFGLEPGEGTDRTCIVVVQPRASSPGLGIGLIVDEVSDVVDLESDQIEPRPAFGKDEESSVILGMGKIGDKVVILLDIDQVLSRQETEIVELTAARETEEVV